MVRGEDRGEGKGYSGLGARGLGVGALGWGFGARGWGRRRWPGQGPRLGRGPESASIASCDWSCAGAVLMCDATTDSCRQGEWKSPLTY